MLLTVTGGSGAGKTTLASALTATAPYVSTRVLHGDDYYFDTPERGVWMRDDAGVPHLDFGSPQSMDIERLTRDANAALAKAAVVIIEGLFARHVTPTARCARFDVFVDLPADLRLVRKIQRKCLLHGFPLDVLLRNYLHHRRAAHELHVEPARCESDLVLDGILPADTLAHQVWSAAGKKL
ncbi:uridine kinase [Streptomyces sp. NPDC059788]|uniref:uridine kinase family protein n=1 Tax=Streptomyces sp. NPDC059788 TaxID=3346948 RepID=UPI0036662C1E